MENEKVIHFMQMLNVPSVPFNVDAIAPKQLFNIFLKN